MTLSAVLHRVGGFALKIVSRHALLHCVPAGMERGNVLEAIDLVCLLISRGWSGVYGLPVDVPLREGARGPKGFFPLLWCEGYFGRVHIK